MPQVADSPDLYCAERYAEWAAGLELSDIPSPVQAVCESMVLDVAGLCVAAAGENYVAAVIASLDGDGPCTLLGHKRGLDAASAALVNGTAAHGEDFDDSFEGTPVHAGAVVVPAVLAACERFGRSGADALLGITVGAELMCRMALVAPTAIHRAGFHPTAVIGALGAAAGVGRALGHTPRQITDALGIAGSLASGIIEYLAEGTWTKRLHAGWAAHNGVRAALLAAQGFLGPRTVIEGEHGFFHAFAAPTVTPDYGEISVALGKTWRMEGVAFKPYACGTMAHPYIDCAIRMANDGIAAADITEIQCRVGEGTVHRLWEPLAEKHRPTTPYSAKFSVPFCIAVAALDGAVGLGQFTEARIRDLNVLTLADKVTYEIDPENEYPRNYTGHLRVTLADGRVREFHQPHLRGGVRGKLSRDELAVKFRANAAHGDWPRERTERLEHLCGEIFDRSRIDLSHI